MSNPTPEADTTTRFVQSLKTSIFPELHHLMLPQVVAAAEELTGVTGDVVTFSEDHYRFLEAAYELMAEDPAKWNITGPSGAKWWTPAQAR